LHLVPEVFQDTYPASGAASGTDVEVKVGVAGTVIQVGVVIVTDVLVLVGGDPASVMVAIEPV